MKSIRALPRFKVCRRCAIRIAAGLSLILLSAMAAADAAEPSAIPGRTALVGVGASGKLEYHAYSPRGDVLPDFSHCGYAGGDRTIPDLPVRASLAPAAGEAADDFARIQAALDRVAALPADEHGWRGAVLLQRGVYRSSGTLRIAAGGVVLRGEGDGEDGTTIIATIRKAEPLIAIGGASGAREIAGSAVEIADDYVPVGARRFRVADAKGFAVGQSVFVTRRGNAAWISEIGMDRITGRPTDPESTRQWEPFELRFDRVITAIEGDAVTVDAPIVCAIEREWGGGRLVRYADDQRVQHCGVERLRAVSEFDSSLKREYGDESVFVDQMHANYLVSFGHVKNAWARGLTTVHFAHGPATIGGSAKWITVEDCRSLDPVSLITGGTRYPYSINGQLALVQRCYAWGARHAFVFGARVPGPNAIVDCVSEKNYASSEPHHRWSVGGLYDNVEGHIAIQDRQWMGSGHGWSGANYVVWNSRGKLVVQQPPTAQNFAIGFVGERDEAAFERPEGWWESEGAPVYPKSLYRKQLEDRVGQPAPAAAAAVEAEAGR